MVIVLQVISKCLIRHYSEMSIVSIFLDIRKCSPEDLCVALEEANEIRKEEMSVSFKVIGCDEYFGNDGINQSTQLQSIMHTKLTLWHHLITTPTIGRSLTNQRRLFCSQDADSLSQESPSSLYQIPSNPERNLPDSDDEDDTYSDPTLMDPPALPPKKRGSSGDRVRSLEGSSAEEADEEDDIQLSAPVVPQFYTDTAEHM
ncbi:uncharacterized protein LOC134180875 [Corticium candelabrum]|uniref:uncharacterized protein LOC134180875 n=1 Tax=Corticium candelabrum TaxID=121492 RepID=UPI002E26AE92|nr:uncharacterized protein LOC134180875 [Corticium candelabrum]